MIEGPGRQSVDLDDDENINRQRKNENVSQGVDNVTVLCYTAVMMSPLGGGVNVHFDLRNGETSEAKIQ